MIDSSIKPDEYQAFRTFLQDACGIVLGDNKHYLVSSRLNRLMREFSVPSVTSLLERLKREKDSQLRARIIDAMTTNETMWFRDVYPFEVLRGTVLPELAAARGRSCRIWSAACSSGQEPYSIAMTISEFQLANLGSLAAGVQIAATDISPTMLKVAKAGVYDQLSMARGLSDERKQRFFQQQDDGWAIKPEIRSRVTFSELNLMASYAALGRFDVIYCRNVLIYFSTDLKRDILRRMAMALNPRGFLFLGGSESPSSYSDAFEMVRAPQGVVYRLKAGWKP